MKSNLFMVHDTLLPSTIWLVIMEFDHLTRFEIWDVIGPV